MSAPSQRRASPLDLERVVLDGTTLIEASAGTGKTHTIATLYVRLLLEKGYGVAEILVVTYTRAATAELRLRIRRRIEEAREIFASEQRDAVANADPVLVRLAERAAESGSLERARRRLEDALHAFDEASIFTIHGFCSRVLTSHTFESGAAFDLRLSEQDHLLVVEVVQDYWSAELSDSSESFAAHLRACNTTIAALTNLVDRTASNPDILLVPEPAAQPLDALEARFVAARAQLISQWQTAREPVLQLLCDGRLHATVYKPAVIRDEWAPQLDLLAERAPGQLPGFFRWLNPRCLREKVKKGKPAPEHPFFGECAELEQRATELAGALDSQLIAFRHGLIQYARRELPKRKARAASVGFDDLLLQLRAAVGGPGGEVLLASLRTAHPAALIDEFQDTDPIQAEIFQRIYDPERPEPGTLLLVGDPKQAIYAFRGADIFAYLQASESAYKTTLPVNYRSDPSLLRAVNTLFGRARNPFYFPEIEYHPVAPQPAAKNSLRGALSDRAPFELLYLSRGALGEPTDKGLIAKSRLDQILPDLIASEIVRVLSEPRSYIDDRAIEPRHIAVLCRTNRQAQRIQAALRQARVPSVLDGDSSVFDSGMAPELARVIAAMAEPGDAGLVRAALATSLLDVSGNELMQLEQPEHESEWDAWISLFHELCELWQTRGFIRALHALLDHRKVPERLLSRIDGERRYTDLMHLVELLHTEAMQSRKGPLALVEWFRRMCQSEAERSGMAAADMQIRLESDAHAVTLTTVHKSKGLEYPLVYCPYCWDGMLLRGQDDVFPRFHATAQANKLTLDLGSRSGKADPEHIARATDEALAEELRLLYVALTRAKHRVSVVWGPFKDAPTAALGYLLHQPEAAAPSGDGTSVFLSDLARTTALRIKGLSDAEIERELAALAAAAGGSIEVRSLGLGASAELVGSPEVVPELSARTLERLPEERQRTSSFSRLISERGSDVVAAPISVIEGIDRDEAAELTVAEPLEAERPRVLLADFPAGASFGHLVHEIYEQIDFRAAAPEDLLEQVQGTLAAYAVEDAPADVLARALWESLRTPLSAGAVAEEPAAASGTSSDPDADLFARELASDPGAGGLPSLSVVAPESRIVELEFVFPVEAIGARPTDRPPVPPSARRTRPPPNNQLQLFAAPSAGGVPGLQAQRLAELFAVEARTPTERAYAIKLKSLGFAPLAGFLRGFMDLVVEHDGRYYLLDYKSNHLGDYPEDYTPAKLQQVMVGHHYVLQAVIYTLALDRYLRHRLPGYEYTRHFGGIYYLFVRGMSPEFTRGTGVHAERPSPNLIAALDAALRGEPSR